jgi:phosphoribosyl 1,2-cyclic phosphodiesterase
MAEKTLSVTLWGVRGGHPQPGPTTNKFGGNTTCMEIRAGKHLIIIDAGTGIIRLGERLAAQHRVDKKPIVATILFTHTHHDHTQGFPFFVPSFIGSSTLYIFGPKLLHEDLERALARAMLPPAHPVSLEELNSMQVIRNISDYEAIVFTEPGTAPHVCNVYRECEICSSSPWQARVTIMRSYAHPQHVFCYRVEVGDKALVVATDTEGYVGGDKRLIRFAHGADLLIHDAEYTAEEYLDPIRSRQGWGHSTWEMAVEVAQAANVKRLILTHHNARHDDAFLEDMERQAQAILPATTMAREGLTIET